jgi:hypothetical protein
MEKITYILNVLELQYKLYNFDHKNINFSSKQYAKYGLLISNNFTRKFVSITKKNCLKCFFCLI